MAEELDLTKIETDTSLLTLFALANLLDLTDEEDFLYIEPKLLLDQALSDLRSLSENGV